MRRILYISCEVGFLRDTAEIQCLFPQPDTLFITQVDQKGNVLRIGILPRDGFMNYNLLLLQIAYEKK